MTLRNMLALLSFSALVAATPAHAARNSNDLLLGKQHTQQRSDLERFSDAFSLRFINASTEEQQGKVFLTFKYQVENRSNKAIKRVHWATYYTYNNQILLTQDLPLSFENFQPNSQLPIDFSIAWDNLPQAMKETIADSSKSIVPQYQAKSIEFVDGTKIEVK